MALQDHQVPRHPAGVPGLHAGVVGGAVGRALDCNFLSNPSFSWLSDVWFVLCHVIESVISLCGDVAT